MNSARTKIYFAAVAALFLSVFLSPSPSAGKTVISKNGRDKGSAVRIALALPTGGRFAFFTKQFINGLLLSLNKQGGLNIKYSIINLPAGADGSNVSRIFASLSKKNASAVIGPLFEGQLKYFASDSVKFKIPVITPSPVIAKEDLSPFVFSYGMTLRQEIKTEMKYAAYAGIGSVSAIYPDGGYGLKIMSYINLFCSSRRIVSFRFLVPFAVRGKNRYKQKRPGQRRCGKNRIGASDRREICVLYEAVYKRASPQP